MGKNFKKTTVIFGINTLEFLSTCKVLQKKQKPLILGPKCLIWVFLGQNFDKNIVIFELSTLEFVKYESLTHAVNFDMRSYFSKGLGLGPGPLYKVYPLFPLITDKTLSSNLNANKAHGDDMNSIGMLKLCDKSICKPFHIIPFTFKSCLAQGIFRSEWRRGLVFIFFY